MKSPIEQFEIVPLLKLELYENTIDITITNFFFANFTILAFSLLLIYSIAPRNISYKTYRYKKTTNATFKVRYNSVKNNFFFIPNRWQLFIEYLIITIFQLATDNLGNSTETQKFLPFIFTLFITILLSNLAGLLPYSFTITSHFVITFLLSFSVFIGTIVICIETHSFRVVELFVPANTSFFFLLLLVPIEFVSFIARPISLGVRLFINLMAGHCLLKVIIGFSWIILALEDILPMFHLIPLALLVLLFGLEIGVALIQAYVFTLLSCIYLSNCIKLH